MKVLVEAWTAARGSTGPDDARGTHAHRCTHCDKSSWRACDVDLGTAQYLARARAVPRYVHPCHAGTPLIVAKEDPRCAPPWRPPGSSRRTRCLDGRPGNGRFLTTAA